MAKGDRQIEASRLWAGEIQKRHRPDCWKVRRFAPGEPGVLCVENGLSSKRDDGERAVRGENPTETTAARTEDGGCAQ